MVAICDYRCVTNCRGESTWILLKVIGELVSKWAMSQGKNEGLYLHRIKLYNHCFQNGSCLYNWLVATFEISYI